MVTRRNVGALLFLATFFTLNKFDLLPRDKADLMRILGRDTEVTVTAHFTGKEAREPSRELQYTVIPAGLPSAVSAGYMDMDTYGHLSWYDGNAWQQPPENWGCMKCHN